MSAATIEAATFETSAFETTAIETVGSLRPRQLRRPRRLRPSQGSGRRGGPVGRARTGVAAPSLGSSAIDDYLADSCEDARTDRRLAAAPAIKRSDWRLTDRGIALVLITGAVLLAAAVTVIAATAITVTSTNYVQPGHSAVAGR